MKKLCDEGSISCPALQTVISILSLLSAFRCAVALALHVAALNFTCEQGCVQQASE